MEAILSLSKCVRCLAKREETIYGVYLTLTINYPVLHKLAAIHATP